jgi:hypothetical protein
LKGRDRGVGSIGRERREKRENGGGAYTLFHLNESANGDLKERERERGEREREEREKERGRILFRNIAQTSSSQIMERKR